MASPSAPPSTMRAWQYSTATGGLEKNLKLSSVPVPTPKPDQHLVQILHASLNPVDYKPAENALLSRLLIAKPATPGVDFAGRIVVPAAGSGLARGALVCGAAGTNFMASGALAEYAVAKPDGVFAVPDGVPAPDAAAVPVAGLTALQTIRPRVRAGDRVFINGGSGGTGTYGIQIAKLLGCRVTATCSTPNVALCRGLGADHVIDYRQENVLEALKAYAAADGPYDHIVDNVGNDYGLYWRCHEYARPGAVYMAIAGEPSLRYAYIVLAGRFWPAWLGGGRRPFETFLTSAVLTDGRQLVEWMAEGKVKAVIDAHFPFEETVQAFERLKTKRARGKIIVDVAKE